MSSSCSSCGGVATVAGCGCGGSAPQPLSIRACLPGAHQPVTWAAWQAGCWPKGMIFRVTDGPCPGMYVGNGGNGVAADRIMQRENFKTANGFRFPGDGCDPAVDWSQIDWDDLCAEAETAAPADADYIIYCKGGNVKKSTFGEFFENVCYDLPAMATDACDIETVAYAKDADGCGKLVRYSEASVSLGVGRFYHTQRDRGVAIPPANVGYIWPDDLAAAPYDMAELAGVVGALDDTGLPAVQANELRLEGHVAATLAFDLTCPAKLELDWRYDVRSELNLKGGMTLWRWKVAGSALWHYSRNGTALSSAESHNAVVQEVSKTVMPGPSLVAGSFIIQLLVMPADSANPVKYNFIDGPIALPRLSVRKRVG